MPKAKFTDLGFRYAKYTVNPTQKQIHTKYTAKYTVGVCCCWQTGWSHSKHFHVKSNLTISISGLEGGHMTAA